MENITRHKSLLRLSCKTALATALFAVAFSKSGLAQPASVLRIGTGNAVLYNEDTSDVLKFATDSTVTTPAATKNFNRAIALADIQAVNGQPVTGLHTRAVIANMVLRPVPTPGQAIADVSRNAAAVISFEILRSDGTPTRDYVHVDDVVGAYLLLCERSGRPEVQGQPFNFGAGEPHSATEIVDRLRRLLGREDLEPIVAASAQSEIPSQYLDATKAGSVLGWQPTIDLETGLARTVEWYRAYFGR